MVQRVSHFCKKSFLIFSFMCGLGSFVKIYSDGLPGEYLASQHWRYLFSSQSPVSNPALVNEENYLSLRYALSSSMSEFLMQEIGIVNPIGLYQSVALTALLQGVGTYDATGEDQKPTGEKLNDQQYFIMGSYAWNIWSGLTFGVNVNFLYYPFNGNSMGLGFDAGLTYRILNNPVIGTHLLGVSLQNAAMVLMNSKDVYPKNIRISLTSNYWERRIESGFDFALKDVLPNKNQFVSPDSSTSLMELNAKLGVWVLRFASLYGIASFDNKELKAWGFASGFNIPGINDGRDILFMYQYLTLPNSLSPNHTIYAKGDFGKHREEIYARKMARMVNVSPNNLYLRAVQLYSQGNYWDAFFLFSQIYVEFPDFFKNDWVSYFMSSCQENLDMRSSTIDAYNKTKSQFTKSNVIPYVDLGLMRVFYRDDNFQAVEQQFNELNKYAIPDSIKFHSYYIMGETEMKLDNKEKASQLFKLIPEDHPDYVFAQHSLAIVAASSDNLENAISCLENCVQTKTTTNAQKEIVNRSYVFLGYIFYEKQTEEGSLSKAVTSLRMIPKTSYYYPDALLGLGWTGIKARQWNDCMSAGQELASIANNTVLKAEGTLLQAYSLMMQKNYNAALSLLSKISMELTSYKKESDSEFDQKIQDYNEVRNRYSEVSKSALDLGTTRQSSLVEKQIDSLHVLQKQYQKEISDFVSYSDNFQRNSFFNRSFEAVKNDIDYALAKAQKASGSIKNTKETGKINKETEKIDNELERLKKELEKEQNKGH